MSPSNIVAKAKEVGLSIIGIADHNSTKHCALVRKIADKEGIFVLMGVEVTTKEEAHCLTFFPDEVSLNSFQRFIDDRLPSIPLDVDLFGYQVVVNEDDEIVEEVPYLLISGLNASIEEIEKMVHALGGLFIPAHINKNKFSVISQLGFIPFDLVYDALEISPHTTPAKFCSLIPGLKAQTFIQCSDSHIPDTIGSAYTIFNIAQPTFDEVKLALHRTDGRYVAIP
jgi:PHP family Zn ribbon phosphoesterase